MYIADAFFAPVIVGRFRTYELPVANQLVNKYFERIENLPEIKDWINQAKKEEFVLQNEKYRSSRL
jgi:hypothetical protein